jgi:hypothetical protein
MIPGMARTVYLVYPDGHGWVVRRDDGARDAGFRSSTREAALLRARELADESRPSRIEVTTSRGMIVLNYEA